VTFVGATYEPFCISEIRRLHSIWAWRFCNGLYDESHVLRDFMNAYFACRPTWIVRKQKGYGADCLPRCAILAKEGVDNSDLPLQTLFDMFQFFLKFSVVLRRLCLYLPRLCDEFLVVALELVSRFPNRSAHVFDSLLERLPD
jgi:hypothetical protein